MRTHPSRDDTAMSTTSEPAPRRDLDILACPNCQGRLRSESAGLVCEACGHSFSQDNGIPNLLMTEPFEDDAEEDRWLNEEKTGAFLTESYLIPLIEGLYSGRAPSSIRILSIGCGVGRDVEVLSQAGYDPYGIDAGRRTDFWARRVCSDRFFLAGAQKLPFQSEQFDFTFMNCVLPHIGVVGDSQDLKSDFEAQRWAAVQETIRVIKPGGYIMVANPNRLCPLDLFHRPKDHVHIPRMHAPNEPFLQSYGDLRRYFVERGGCESIRTLPLENYWGFFISSGYGVGRILQRAVKGYFSVLSWKGLAFLRPTLLNPWLVVLVRK